MGEQSLRQRAQIARLQKNLCALRRIAGWTMAELGDRIGVTKQTISNLENPNKQAKMTLTQYLAIRSVLDYEAAQRLEKDNTDTLLLLAIRKVLDEELDEDILEEAEDDVALLASAVAGGTPREKVQKLALERLSLPAENTLPGLALGAVVGTIAAAAITGGLPILPVVLGGGIAGYLEKLFSDDDPNDLQSSSCDNKNVKESDEL